MEGIDHIIKYKDNAMLGGVGVDGCDEWLWIQWLVCLAKQVQSGIIPLN